MSNLIRLRYNTMAHETPNGELKWRVILEKNGGFEEVLVKELVLNVPSFSKSDEMPVGGWVSSSRLTPNRLPSRKGNQR